MLVRNKKVIATAQWEESTLRNPSLQVQGLVLRDRHACIRLGVTARIIWKGLWL